MSRPLYGLVAQFASPTELVKAARQVHAAGYTRVDAYTPYPMEEVIEALHLGRSSLPKIVLVGGIVGLVGGWALQYWTSVIQYPMNIGGRPFNSWPAFVIPTFETTVLLAALSAVLGMLALNGLPRPYHPVFNARNFSTASTDSFFLCIEAADPKFDREAARKFLAGLGGDVSEAEE